ncbi:MAG: NUDIX hydrolase [bacterium]|nr:NUDIX hydrolase [bacterium]
MKIRILARVVTYDPNTKKILLVRNKGTKFWYAPGGEWQQDTETILEAAAREVREETGLEAEIIRLLYLQEFHATPDTIFFETFWLARPKHSSALDQNHVDLDPQGAVEDAEWFDKDSLADLKVFPERLKNTFWDRTEQLLSEEDPFIGVS